MTKRRQDQDLWDELSQLDHTLTDKSDYQQEVAHAIDPLFIPDLDARPEVSDAAYQLMKSRRTIRSLRSTVRFQWLVIACLGAAFILALSQVP